MHVLNVLRYRLIMLSSVRVFLSGKRIDKQKYIANLFAVNKLNFSRYDNSRKSLHFLTVQLVVHVPYIISNNVFQIILKATVLIFKKSMFEKYML